MSYNMNTLNREVLVELIKNGDDSHHNQIRVIEYGTIFLYTKVGAEDISGLRFRFETFDAGNGYVGPEAFGDDDYIDHLYNALIKAWKLNRNRYIDDLRIN